MIFAEAVVWRYFIKKCFEKVCKILSKTSVPESLLTLSCRRSLSYSNQSTGLHSKSMDWFLYVSDLSHERVIQVPGL